MTDIKDQTMETGSTSKTRQFVTVGDYHEASGTKPGIGYWTAFMHLVKGYIGTGVFALGQGMKNSGLILGPILLAFLAVMNLDCQHMLLRAGNKVADLEEEDVRPSFSEIVEYTAESSDCKWLQKNAQRLGFMINIFLCITELGFCCVYFIFIARHIIEITSNYGFLSQDHIESTHIMLAIILLPVWLSTFLGNLKLLFPLTLTANVVMWTGLLMVFYFTSQGKYTDLDKLDFVSYEHLPVFFGIALFAFEGITFIIPLRNEMKVPEKFTSPLGVLNTGMAFVYLIFTSVGVVAYWKYGEDIKSSVFLNLPNGSILSNIIKALISLGVLFTFTLHMYIVFSVTYPLFHRKYGPFKHNVLAQILYRSVPVLLTFTLANVVPLLGLFISLVGASTGSFLALILPPVLDFIAFKKELKTCQIIKNVVIISIGVVGAVAGTIMSIYDIVIEIKSHYQADNSTSR